MNHEHSSRTPLLVGIVLAAFLALGVYVGAYFALVEPGLVEVVLNRAITAEGRVRQTSMEVHYKGGAHRVAWIFWPMEQIDRKIRPNEWTY